LFASFAYDQIQKAAIIYFYQFSLIHGQDSRQIYLCVHIKCALIWLLEYTALCNIPSVIEFAKLIIQHATDILVPFVATAFQEVIVKGFCERVLTSICFLIQ